MKQEQKPFEIKEINVLQTMTAAMVNISSVKKIDRYIKDANAEIRRLQGENDHLITENESLKQQLAAAPSWGEWVDATEGELSNVSAGVYELEDQAGATEISFMFDGKWQTESCTMSDWTVAKENLRFRRLNYEPKPAREVEKTYGDATAKELSRNPYLAKEWSDLAFDLVVLQEKYAAAQAELRELKGKR